MAKEPELDLERVRQMARQFPENGMKMLLENPAPMPSKLKCW